MIKPASRRAAIVLAGSALALAAGLIPAQAATTGWRTDATVATRGYETVFTSVAASSRADAWATGLSGNAKGTKLQTVIRHWTGKTWRSVTLPAKTEKAWAKTDPFITEVGAASSRSVWVFGGFYGGYLRLNGSRWSVATLPGGGAKSGNLLEIDAVKVFSGSNAWAFGVLDSLSSSTDAGVPYAAHYNGKKWSRVGVPGSGAISAVAAPSAGEIWAVEDATAGLTGLGIRSAINRTAALSASGTAPVVLEWTASTGWVQAALQPALSDSDVITSAAAEPNGDIWIGGSAPNKASGTTPVAADWNGTAWSSVSDLPMKASSTDWALEAMAPDGSGGLWGLAEGGNGSGRVFQLTSTKWSTVSTSFGKHPWVLLALTLVPGTRSAWGVGAVEASKSSANGLIAVTGALPR